jgi:transcriptional regulator with XRE-family HTH domain
VDTYTSRVTKCVVERSVSGRDLRRLRQKLGESASVFGARLGVSRSRVKHMEAGTQKVSRRIQRLVEELEEEVGRGKKKHEDVVVVSSSFALPCDRFTLLPRPRRCRGHGNWFVFRNSRQVYCSKECRKLYLRRLRMKGGDKRVGSC